MSSSVVFCDPSSVSGVNFLPVKIWHTFGFRDGEYAFQTSRIQQIKNTVMHKHCDSSPWRELITGDSVPTSWRQPLRILTRKLQSKNTFLEVRKTASELFDCRTRVSFTASGDRHEQAHHELNENRPRSQVPFKAVVNVSRL